MKGRIEGGNPNPLRDFHTTPPPFPPPPALKTGSNV